MTDEEARDILREALEYSLQLLEQSRVIHEMEQIYDRAMSSMQADKITIWSRKCSKGDINKAMQG